MKKPDISQYAALTVLLALLVTFDVVACRACPPAADAGSLSIALCPNPTPAPPSDAGVPMPPLDATAEVVVVIDPGSCTYVCANVADRLHCPWTKTPEKHDCLDLCMTEWKPLGVNLTCMANAPSCLVADGCNRR